MQKKTCIYNFFSKIRGKKKKKIKNSEIQHIYSKVVKDYIKKFNYQKKNYYHHLNKVLYKKYISYILMGKEGK